MEGDMRSRFVGMMMLLALILLSFVIVRLYKPIAMEGRSAPNFAAGSLHGHTMTLADLRGRPVYIGFLSPYGLASREEAVALERLFREYGSRDAFFVVLPAPNAAWIKADQQFVRQLRPTFPVMLDSGAIHKLYAVTAPETNIWITTQGTIASRVNRPLGYTALRSEFAAVGR